MSESSWHSILNKKQRQATLGASLFVKEQGYAL